MKHFVSIIIPILNAEKYIKECLYSLSNLAYPKESLEIIAVDGGSSDKTSDIAEKFNVSILRESKATISTLRNIGARKARGSILAFVDSDCVVQRDWLKNALEILSDENMGAVGEEYRLPDKPSWIEKIWDMQIAGRRKNREVEWLPSGNLVMTKRVFDEIGGFNEGLVTSEDVDLCRRIRQKGLKVVSDDRLAVTHLGNPKNIKEFFLKEIWRGKGAFQNFLRSLPQVKPTRAVSLALFTLFCVFGMIAGSINGMVRGGWQLFFMFLLGLISVSVILAVKSLLREGKWAYMFPLAFLFLVYGLARAVSVVEGITSLSHTPRLPPSLRTGRSR